MPTSQGTLTLPQTTESIALDGRQSKLVITDYSFGTHGSLLYTTASVFFAGTIGPRDVLFLYGSADQSHEFAFEATGTGTVRTPSSRIRFPPSSATGGYTTVAVLPQPGSDPAAPGLLVIWDSDEQLVLFADPGTAATFWAPAIRFPAPIQDTAVEGLENYWRFGTNATVLVGGPHLVRNATLARDGHGGTTLALRGDLNASVPLTVIAPPGVRAVSWNGKAVEVRGDGRGVLSGRLVRSVDVERVRVPKLEGWKFRDSLPEVRPGFDDSDWVVADRTTTNIFLKPVFGDGRVLYGAFTFGRRVLA